MPDWCAPILQALAQRDPPCELFFRDDDGGWDDRRLIALLDVFERHQVALDLAVIPAALTPSLASELVARLAHGGEAAPGVHQHGFAHDNHESAGRKCEFGASRTRRQQLADIEAGHAILAAAFGSLADPIFTPPWNRCTADTAAALAELGFAALSRDQGATPLPGSALAEIAVTVDWCKFRSPGSSPAELAQRIAASLAGDARCGIMLHHAVMDADDLALLDTLLPLLREHPKVRCRPMRALLPARPRTPRRAALASTYAGER